MVPVCDKRYHIYNRFRHFWAEIKKLWNYPLSAQEFNYPSCVSAVAVITEAKRVIQLPRV